MLEVVDYEIADIIEHEKARQWKHKVYAQEPQMHWDNRQQPPSGQSLQSLSVEQSGSSPQKLSLISSLL
ncbi:unnamed protein product [Linum trigynum]|uniref:Uncharacterized protein n=1 Tax=Linum trigynum TaxID=586398 RepID=A0AAV2G638_9ROSI